MPEADIAKAEHRLGIRVPDPLRSFYLVAGKASDYIDHYDHFLPPSEWDLSGDKLIFLSENQEAVLYAVEYTDSRSDGPVFIASNEDPLDWHEVCPRVSEFILVMLRWEGAFGGALPSSGWALAPQDAADRLAVEWSYIGAVNEMNAYSQASRAACHVQWDDGWRIFLGARSREDLMAAFASLGVDIEDVEE